MHRHTCFRCNAVSVGVDYCRGCVGHVPSGYKVFELPWRGCWHFRRGGGPLSKCYDDESQAAQGARDDFERWANDLRVAARTC
jgi:hypothetical protein